MALIFSNNETCCNTNVSGKFLYFLNEKNRIYNKVKINKFM